MSNWFLIMDKRRATALMAFALLVGLGACASKTEAPTTNAGGPVVVGGNGRGEMLR